MPRILIKSVMLLAFCGAASLASAQFTGAFAPPPSGAMDTLSGASVGPNPAPYMNAAQAVPGAPGAPPAPGGIPPAPGAAPTPAAAQPAYSPYGYGNYGGTTPGVVPGQTATPTPTPIPTTKVFEGMRVTDAVTGEIIDDARFVEVPQAEVEGKYFDDGTHGDEAAGDLVYSNVTERNDVIGAESNQILMRLINSLESADNMNPLEFYRLNVLTTEVISEIDQWRVQEAEKDKVLRSWLQRFVQKFKKNPEDVSSHFYELYVVSPPPRPSVALPAIVGVWSPPTAPGMKVDTAAQTGTTGGGGGYGSYGY